MTTAMHLYTAASTYLLLSLLWFALYSCVDVFYPGAIQQSRAGLNDRSTELLYFSLVTLSTIGYGDIVPIGGEVRCLLRWRDSPAYFTLQSRWLC